MRYFAVTIQVTQDEKVEDVTYFPTMHDLYDGSFKIFSTIHEGLICECMCDMHDVRFLVIYHHLEGRGVIFTMHVTRGGFF